MILQYIRDVVGTNVFASKLGFHVCTHSGIPYLEGVLDRFRTESRFVAVSDTCDQRITRPAGTWLRRRTYTVVILSRYKLGYIKDYERALDECRELYRQLLSRFLHDLGAMQNKLLYMDLTDVKSEELGGEFLNNTTGLYFLLTVDQPIDISYKKNEWI